MATPHPHDVPASHLIPNANPVHAATAEAQQDVARRNPGTLTKTEDVNSTPSLGAVGEQTQGARTADMGNPSKA